MLLNYRQTLLAAILAVRLSPEQAVRALMERLPKPELVVAPGTAL